MNVQDLHEALAQFARSLASEKWYSSPSYETTVQDQINEAVASCKADIGDRLLEVLLAIGIPKESHAG